MGSNRKKTGTRETPMVSTVGFSGELGCITENDGPEMRRSWSSARGPENTVKG